MNNNLSNKTVCIASLLATSDSRSHSRVSTTPADDRLRRGCGQDQGTRRSE